MLVRKESEGNLQRRMGMEEIFVGVNIRGQRERVSEDGEEWEMEM